MTGKEPEAQKKQVPFPARVAELELDAQKIMAFQEALWRFLQEFLNKMNGMWKAWSASVLESPIWCSKAEDALGRAPTSYN